VIAPVSEAEREAVRVAQRALRLTPTGNMDEPTKASLRGTQRLYGLPVTGILDAATAIVIDELRPWKQEEEEKPCRPY
jgi:peptidoglycan hydrolase-like protein with peptidoglycan-binding domain